MYAIGITCLSLLNSPMDVRFEHTCVNLNGTLTNKLKDKKPENESFG